MDQSWVVLVRWSFKTRDLSGVVVYILLHSRMYTTTTTGKRLVVRASLGKIHGRHYFSPQQNGAKNHWTAWQCTFNLYFFPPTIHFAQTFFTEDCVVLWCSFFSGFPQLRTDAQSAFVCFTSETTAALFITTSISAGKVSSTWEIRRQMLSYWIVERPGFARLIYFQAAKKGGSVRVLLRQNDLPEVDGTSAC